MNLSSSIAAYANATLDFEALMQEAAQQAIGPQRVEGTVYTPSWIVARILDTIAPTAQDRVLDPAVGRGAFLIPLLEHTTQGMSAQDALSWLNNHTASYDVDAAALDDLRAILCAWFWRTYRLDVPPSAITALHHGDGLTPQPQRFDAVIGNPPYIRFQAMDAATRTSLQARFLSCAKGNVDLYYAFIEHALACADRVGFVVPNSFLTTQSGKTLRALLDGRVSSIVDFGHDRVFPGIGTYTCLLFAQANPTGATITDHASGTTRPYAAHTPRPPILRSVSTGIATLCDKAYAVERQGDQFIATLTGLPVEKALVRPLIKATKFRGSTHDWTTFVLHPYVNGTVLDPTSMASYPLALAHLEAVRPLLEARDKGHTQHYPAWYAYGRGQGLHPLQGPQALIVPAMMGGQSQPRLADLTPFAAYGGALLVSGYAIDHPTHADITTILSEAFIDTVRTHGAAKPGAQGQVYHAVASWMVKTQTAPRTL